MKSILDKKLKESALEDIAEMIKIPLRNGENYITHVSNLMIDYAIRYIQKKFSISNKELKDYLKHDYNSYLMNKEKQKHLNTCIYIIYYIKEMVKY